MQSEPPRAGSRGPTDQTSGIAETSITSRANGHIALPAVRREAAGLQRRAALLTSATSQVERRLEELVRRGAAQSRGRNQEKIAELRSLGRDTVRLLEAAVARREAIRRQIAELERASSVERRAAEPPSRGAATVRIPAALDVPVPSATPALGASDRPGPDPVTLPEQASPAAPPPTAHELPAPAPASEPYEAPIRQQELPHLPTHKGFLPAPLGDALRYGAMALMGTVLLALAALLTPLPELFGWQVFAVQSASMEPAIPVGSLIAVRPVPASSLAVGDVITFSEQNRPDVRVTHRIVQLETKDGQRVAVTKGDANNTTDSWNVPVSQAIGRVAFHLPLMGYTLAILGTAPVKLAALAIAGLMLALPSIRRRFAVERSNSQVAVRTESTIASASRAAPARANTHAAVRTGPALQDASPAATDAAATVLAVADPRGSADESEDEDPEASFGALADEIDALLGRLAKDGVDVGKPAARR